ncbi:MAG: hypothetical protein IPP81_05595 [Chitinophagaceae bacterium]|nr:hypothetical protein [Chitinophagaceae bacterium]
MKKLAQHSFICCFVLFFSIWQNATAQTAPTKPADNPATWGIKLYGFVRNDIMYDSRQLISAREGDLSLYAKDKSLDANSKDINAAPTFHMLAITSRLGGTITGPDAFGAKTSAILEAEFFGNFDGGINEFRLRHAWAKLDWSKTQLAFGQYWHPMFVTDCYPGVIDFNTGMPFQPFNRSPQVRLTQKLDKGNKMSLIVAMLAQRDFASVAPSGYNANDPMRNSTVPNMHLQFQYKDAKLVAGVGVDYKSLRPRLNSGTPNVVSNERVGSTSFIGYVKVITKPVVIKAEAVIGENLTDHVMVGGYLGYVATPGAVETYDATKTQAYWMDITGTGKKIVPGFFFGYTANNGAKSGASAAYGRGIGASGRGIKNIFRVSPRVEFISGKFKFGTEIEYTAAQYGTFGNNSKVTGATDKINNTRFLLATTFSF